MAIFGIGYNGPQLGFVRVFARRSNQPIVKFKNSKKCLQNKKPRMFCDAGLGIVA